MYYDETNYTKMRESSVLSMHKNSPEFVEKLYLMLEDTNNEQYIRWNVSSLSFIIINPPEFARNVLENHFKHGNLSSFVRQLNKYDFHKIKSTECVVDAFGPQVWEFKNEFFQRNRRDLMFKIRRKRSSSEKIMRNSSDTGNYGSDLTVMFQNQTLNTLRMITRYFQVIIEDVNELKVLLLQGKNSNYINALKVLIMEDNMACSAFASAVLSKMDFNIIINDSEDEAMTRVENEKFDIYLVGFALQDPGSIVRKIRSINNEAQIILLVDKSCKHESVSYLNIGVDEILIKPYTQETMVQLMGKCVDQKKRNVPWTPYNDMS